MFTGFASKWSSTTEDAAIEVQDQDGDRATTQDPGTGADDRPDADTPGAEEDNLTKGFPDSHSTQNVLLDDVIPYHTCTGIDAYQTCDLTCRTSGYCYEDVHGKGLQWHPVVNCSEFCTPTGCSSMPVPFPAGCGVPKADVIDCITEGIYPGPFDCRKAFYCKPGNKPTICKNCNNGFGYNPCTGKCDLQLPNGQCPGGSLHVCHKLGETKAIIGNEEIFFICAQDANNVIYPVMSRCKTGYFNEELLRCVSTNTNRCNLSHNIRDSC